MHRILAKAFLVLCTLAVCGMASVYAVFNLPQILFPYHAREGRLDLWSDEPFEAEAARRLLADSVARIGRSVLDDHLSHGVVIANQEWHRHLVFLWNYGAAGLNWYPITRNVFIRSASVAENRVIRPTGKPVELPRTLAYYIAHEIGHTLTAEHVGVWRYHREMPRWLREGVADYIGFAGNDLEIDKQLRALRAGDAALDPEKSGTYARYRLLVAYLLDRKGWTMDRLLQSAISQDDAEAIVLGKRN
jgi:hypothetical protein